MIHFMIKYKVLWNVIWCYAEGGIELDSRVRDLVSRGAKFEDIEITALDYVKKENT